MKSQKIQALIEQFNAKHSNQITIDIQCANSCRDTAERLAIWEGNWLRNRTPYPLAISRELRKALSSTKGFPSTWYSA